MGKKPDEPQEPQQSGQDLEDPLILVDSTDRVIGYLDRERCHDGSGVLHRAFSVLIFDAAGSLLVQRRSEFKRLWPLYWSNTCCSHPRRGDSTLVAAERRLAEEFGVRASLRFLYRFEYHARFEDRGSEHELCSVFVGQTEVAPSLTVNPREVSDHRWLPPAEVDQWCSQRTQPLTPWFVQEWQYVRSHYPELFSMGRKS